MYGTCPAALAVLQLQNLYHSVELFTNRRITNLQVNITGSALVLNHGVGGHEVMEAMVIQIIRRTGHQLHTRMRL